MYDKQFLRWLHGKLVGTHKENPNVDYMHKLASIINAMDPKTLTPNTGSKMLDEYEKEIEEALESGDFKEVDNQEEYQLIAKESAGNFLKE